MNSLVEPELIQALYSASQAGVVIDLIVRGVCCLRPGVEGISDNITVRSIIGRFLEHTRIFYFENGDEEELLYLSSADWMDRNFFRRVETCFPIEDRRLRQRIIQESLQGYLTDNAQAWLLQADGTYRRVSAGNARRRSAQESLLKSLAERA
jgi:polyphosphate kinase